MTYPELAAAAWSVALRLALIAVVLSASVLALACVAVTLLLGGAPDPEVGHALVWARV